MLLEKVAKVGSYVRYAESELFNVDIVWKMIFKTGARMVVAPIKFIKNFNGVVPPQIVLMEITEVIGGDGTEESPYEIK